MAVRQYSSTGLRRPEWKRTFSLDTKFLDYSWFLGAGLLTWVLATYDTLRMAHEPNTAVFQNLWRTEHSNPVWTLVMY